MKNKALMDPKINRNIVLLLFVIFCNKVFRRQMLAHMSSTKTPIANSLNSRSTALKCSNSEHHFGFPRRVEFD